MRVGTLDEPDRCPPDVHIHVENKQPWVTLGDDAPRYERFYPVDEVWAVDSIARMGPGWKFAPVP